MPGFRSRMDDWANDPEGFSQRILNREQHYNASILGEVDGFAKSIAGGLRTEIGRFSEEVAGAYEIMGYEVYALVLEELNRLLEKGEV